MIQYPKEKETNVLRDLEQKLRNRPIKITDIAISKVRRIVVPGFNNDENRFIQEQHKRLLSISKDFNNSEEVAIVIDIIHWNTEVILGKENKVKMENNKHANEMLLTCPKNTLLVMHNHPSTSTFSGEDFKMFCDNDSIYVITIVGNDGTLQLMEKNSMFNGQETKVKYGLLAKKYMDAGYINNGTMAMRHIIKHPEQFHIIYKHGGKKR